MRGRKKLEKLLLEEQKKKEFVVNPVVKEKIQQTLECSGSGSDDYERAIKPDRESGPLGEGKAAGYTPRLMTAEIGSDYRYFVINSVFETF